MKGMTLKNIAAACDGKLYATGGDTEIKGVAIDSRKVEKGFLFIAAKGAKTDGHDYITTAFGNGAVGVVCENLPCDMDNGNYILVNDSFAALKQIAAFYRSTLSLPIIGVTGSVGKTSAKEFIASVLGQRFNVLKTDKNFNNEIGLPLTILRIREEHEAAVVEMGISDFGEMSRLGEVARPDACVMTNIGDCHLENLIDRQGVFRAKTEVFGYIRNGGAVFVNNDDVLLRDIRETDGFRVIRFGHEGDVRVCGTENKGLLGSRVTIEIGNETFTADIPIPGAHMVYNALAAAAVGHFMGLPPESIKRGIESVVPIEGRSRVVRTDDYTILDDCYNASPKSMEAALSMLALAAERKVAVLGDMLELGEDEERLHRAVGEHAVKNNIEVLLLTGEKSRWIFNGASDFINQNSELYNNKTKIIYFKSKEDLIDALPKYLNKGDAVLVKASHSMGFETVVSAII